MNGLLTINSFTNFTSSKTCFKETSTVVACSLKEVISGSVNCKISLSHQTFEIHVLGMALAKTSLTSNVKYFASYFMSNARTATSSGLTQTQ